MNYFSPITNINNSMSFHTSYMTCLPQELILAVFDMCTNVNDVINFAESDQYIFDIYKANINIVVKQLMINNQNSLISKIILGAYYNKYYDNEHYNDSIENKLNIVKKIGNYLSNTDYTQMQLYFKRFTDSHSLNNNSFSDRTLYCNYYYLHIVKGHSDILAKLASYLTLEKYNIFIHYINLGNNIFHCNRMIRYLNEQQIELMQTYIDRGLKLDDASNIAENIDEEDVEKVFELHQEHTLSISHAVHMINDFNETQIEKTKQLIHGGINSDIAYDVVDKYSDDEIEIFIKLSKVITDNSVLEDISVRGRSETELNIMLILLENNFSEYNLIYITNALDDFDDYDESYINKCIEFKKAGISEDKIHELLEAGICKDFDDEYYEYLIKNNHSSDSAIDTIIQEYKN